MKAPCYIIVLLCLGGPALSSPATAQEAATVIISEAGGDRALHTLPWRFHAGDDPAWADPAYDDGDWRLVRPDFPADSLAAIGWTGTGWFRLHLVVDATLQGQSLLLGVSHQGASEVYFDGAYILGYGRVGATPSAERRINVSSTSLPLLLPVIEGREHVLAVRYSFTEAAAYSALYRDWLTPGFEAYVARPDEYLKQIVPYENMREVQGGVLLGILLLMCISHLMLYLFTRRDRTNLYFSLFAASFTFTIVCFSIQWMAPFLPHEGFWLPILGFGLLTAGFTFLLRAVYALFYDTLPRPFWAVAVLQLVGFVVFVVTREQLYSMIPIVLLLLEILRVVGRAVWMKQQGGWVVGAGAVGVMAGLLIDGRGPVLDIWGDLLIALSFPLSMSVLLGLRFARTSSRLEAELKNVQALSERTLAQEREKQDLIAGHNERLEAEVVARTAELKRSLEDLRATQQQLVHAEKMASLGALTAGIAHEIKNPLNFVNNFAALSKELVDELEDEDDPVEVKAILSDLRTNAVKIEEHGRRADAIVRSMMQHARGGAGERERVEVNRFVDEYVDLAWHGRRAQQPGFNVDLVRDYGAGVGSVEVVPQDLGRVLINLLGNAFDAVSEQKVRLDGQYGPQVRITTRRGEAGQVVIRVADNGPGIPAGVKAKIFEPFFTTKPTGAGTGLGLSMSYDIVVQGHGGALTVESEPGKGAAFVVTLPGHRQEPMHTEDQQTEA